MPAPFINMILTNVCSRARSEILQESKFHAAVIPIFCNGKLQLIKRRPIEFDRLNRFASDKSLRAKILDVL